MVKKITGLIIALGFLHAANATHIVGGEFELVHDYDYRYRLNLIMYFDHINGNPAAEDNTIQAYIYRKRDNAFITTVRLGQFRDTFVPYSNQDCAIGELVTRKIEYTVPIVLNPGVYNDRGGYYVIWERCCRNFDIDNIIEPGETGQTFYLEFPPVVDASGNRFINSSPILLKPLRDYACIDQLYYADFTGEDPDGDSLVYSMATPLGLTRPGSVVPLPSPAGPYTGSNVLWRPGYSATRQILGSQPLDIDSDGLLTVNPDRSGLFVFSVKVLEFRNGRKIGETRRDFQMLVISCPPPGLTPEVQALFPEKDRYYQEGETLSFNVEDEKCIRFYVRDRNENEKVRFRLKPVNFPVDLSDALSLTEAVLTSPDDSVAVDFCLPNCPYPDIFYLDIIAGDNTCPLPLQDTLRLGLQIEPIVKNNPRFLNGDDTVRVTIQEGESFHLDIEGVDLDKDSVSVAVLSNFALSRFGMNYVQISNVEGNIKAEFDWDSRCDVFPFFEQDEFDIQLLLQDYDICNSSIPDTLNLKLKVILPGTNDPVISTDAAAGTLNLKIGEEINFNVFGEDIDGDSLVLDLVSPISFSFYGINFAGQRGRGNVTAPLDWGLVCDDVGQQLGDAYDLRFILNDLDKCRLPNFDTLEVKVNILPPDNTQPELSFYDNIGGRELDADDLSQFLTDSISVSVVGVDPDGDFITIDLAEIPRAAGYSFTRAEGQGTAQALLTWGPKCSDLPSGSLSSRYQFDFIIEDNKCYIPLDSTRSLNVTLNDFEFDESFLPSNVFSPNGDGINDLFFIDTLPLDNCQRQFDQVIIYNRWGRPVFQDSNRDFVWNGSGLAAGVYYYDLRFTDRVYNGTVHLLR